MKKIISIVLLLGILLSGTVLAESDNTKSELNSQEIIFDAKPILIENKVLVPLREIFETLGFEITWDGATKTITGQNKDTLFKLRIDDISATINGQVIKLDSPVEIINQKTMISTSFIEEVTRKKFGWDKNIKALVLKAEHKDLVNIESIIEYGTEGLVGAHYPVFGKSNIDAISKELVSKYIEEFKNELGNNTYEDKDYKYELNIDYETYIGPSNIISIIFNITEDSSYLAHPDVKIKTKVYDLSNNSEVELDSIMSGEYLKRISQISEDYFRSSETYKNNVDSSVFKEGISPSKENYSNFLFKEDGILFVFEKYQLFSGNFGMPSVKIAYLDLKDFIKPELLEATKEEDLDKIDEEIEEKIDDIVVPERAIDPNKPMIALTFDDGPNKNTTIPILDTLKEHDSVATFFVLGNRASSNGDILKRMLEEGSEIGNHSYNHKELTKLSPAEIKEQTIKTQDAVINATGTEPKVMRPTYGSYNDNLKSRIEMPLILWSIDTLDWESRDAKKVTNHVLENVKDGDIILMHDIYNSTAEAVKSLVPELIDRGYQLVTVSELFESRGEILKDGQIYFSK